MEVLGGPAGCVLSGTGHGVLNRVTPVEEGHGIGKSHAGTIEDAHPGQRAKLLLQRQTNVRRLAGWSVDNHRQGT